jgi:hypothetical protein
MRNVFLDEVILQAQENAALVHGRLNGRCLRLGHRQRLHHDLYLVSKGFSHWGSFPQCLHVPAQAAAMNSITHKRWQHLQQGGIRHLAQHGDRPEQAAHAPD